MDIATLGGIVGTIGCIVFAIAIGGGALLFVNVPSIIIVFFGTAAVTLIKYPLAHSLGTMKIALKTFFHQAESQTELIQLGIELATIARRDGLLGLEGVDIKNEFLAKGIQLAVDGHDEEYVARILATEINQTIDRHERGQHLFKGMGESAPAMGMIGTLIGLVQMMSNMSDPASIGPAMAVALLTTLYGAVLANAVALPIADKLSHRSKEEKNNKMLILEAVSGVQKGMSPKVLEEMLLAYLPGSQRKEVDLTKKS
ncbi:MAG: MotA/TolQ/ExbB proton channel family protein [Bdellovibrionales bacterium]|nr:MotA/TolQ/ExbB proton channel family protein [Bdellovibrionales bacterium]